MKTITIHIPDEVYNRLRQGLTLRYMAGGAGIPEAFTARILELIEAGTTEHTFEVVKRTKEGGSQ